MSCLQNQKRPTLPGKDEKYLPKQEVIQRLVNDNKIDSTLYAKIRF